MSTPTLFLHVSSELDKFTSSSPALSKFSVIKFSGSDQWIQELVDCGAKVAMIQTDNFGADDYDALISDDLIGNIEFIFLSKGVPNEHIDQLTQHGACYHLRSPIDVEFLDELLSEMHQELRRDPASTEKVITSDLDQFGSLVGSSLPMHRLYRLLRKAADSSAKILVIGESGTGKELVANTIHNMSDRHDKPFVALNCGALSPELVESELFGHIKGAFTGANRSREGVFAEAESGTLFLDEITEMPMDLQVKLLRVLETGEYRSVGSDSPKHADVRIIAATNRDPGQAIEQEALRSDLYFRLASFPVYVPPLRERGEDVVGLAKHFLAYRNAEENARKGITREALAKIREHSWPGNVRELKHVIERAFLLSAETIDVEHIIIENHAMDSDDAHESIPQGMTLKDLEQQAIIETLDHNEGKKVETAKQLGISVKTLYNKLEAYEKAKDSQ